MSSFTHTTQTEFRGELAARLGDADNKYWTAAELDEITRETLRTWNCAAQYWRERGSFVTTPGEPFYDLTDKVLASDETTKLLSRTLTDASVMTDCLNSLLESPAIPYDGTEMFTGADFASALERARNRFLAETGMVESTSMIAVPAGQARVTLPDTTIDVRRVAWKTPEGVYTNLWREDERRLTAYRQNFNVELSTPEVYALTLTKPTEVLLAPVPEDNGTLHIVSSVSGAPLDPETGVALGILDDYGWVAKFGALAELLGRDGQAKDEGRAAYCEMRWREGVALARIASSVLHIEINGIPSHLISLNELDAGVPAWQHTTGTPEFAALANHNLVALSPVPAVIADVSDGIHSIVVDVVRNAPIPTDDDPYIDIAREYLGTLLDYAQHLAMFKCGGAEFAATVPLYDSLIKAATRHNLKLRANAPSFQALTDKAQKEGKERKRVEE